LGLLVNSAGGAHARNARRLIHAARKQDRRLAAALLAAALAHTPEAEEALRGARTRMARKPPALARELLRNFPKRRARNARRRRKGAKGGSNGAGPDLQAASAKGVTGGSATGTKARRAHDESQMSGADSDGSGGHAGANGLQSGARETLQRSVEDALNNAEE
jgi:ribonuclease E